MAKRPSYRFEDSAREESIRSLEQAEETLQVFLARLDIPGNPEDAGGLLRQYIVDVHLNIEWYVRRLHIEKLWQRLFVTGSVLLLPGIPALIWGLSHFSDSTTTWTATQVTAVLTGVLAIHKSVAAWLDKRQLFGHFWRASAELKELLYSFELKWRGKAVAGGALRPELCEALVADLTRARQVVREERQGFYELYKSPSFDVFHKLNEAFTQSQSMTTQLRLPSTQDRAAREQAEAEQKNLAEDASRRKRGLEAELQGLERLLEQQEAALAGADGPSRGRIEQSVGLLYQDMDQVRRNLIKVEAELASLG